MEFNMITGLQLILMKAKRKKGRGGKRKGAGRKPSFGEPTTTIAFRVPKSKVKDIKKTVKKRLSSFTSTPSK